MPLTAADRASQTSDVTIGIRPESFRISDHKDGIPVKVSIVEELGADAYLYGVTEDEDAHQEGGLTAGKDVVVRIEARRTLDKGSIVHMNADPSDIHVFVTDSGERLGRRGG